MSKIVAIIPARGGSKGIPRKNIRLFCGKPLLQYSIEAARAARLVDEVYVSTEDKEIAEIARSLDAEIIDRPEELAGDNISTFAVLKHAAESIDFPDVLVTLQPTSPLRTARHIDEAISLLDDDVETVVGVCAAHYYCWRIEDGYGKPDFDTRLPRQKMPKQYIENGSVYVTRKSVIAHDDDKLGMGISSIGKVKLYEMEEIHFVDMDSLFDFKLLECIYKTVREVGEK
ncbi:MAG: acylneuraminate cytidylyltransferase family protein [Candidatus Scalindua sp.]